MQKSCSTIAIIDSGIGGISVLKGLIAKFHAGNYIYFADNLNMPYGNKEKGFIKDRVNKIITSLNEDFNVDLIIIACNTASSCINVKDYNNVLCLKFIPNEVYLITELTKKNLSNKVSVADKTLAKSIENNIFNKQLLKKNIKTHVKKHNLTAHKRIILGCTHYELVEEEFKTACPETEIVKNSDFIINDILVESSELNVKVLTSLNSKTYEDKIWKLIRS